METKILTKRECDVLFLMSKGYSNAVIAHELFISAHTVNAHIESIYRKFEVTNRVQAVVFGIKNNIITTDVTE